MSWLDILLIGLCLFGLFRGFTRGFLKEMAAFIGALIALIITPLVFIGLNLVWQKMFQGSWNAFSSGPLAGLIFVVVCISFLGLLPLSIMAFQFIAQKAELFLVRKFRHAPTMLNNRLLGACVGAARYAIYVIVILLVIGFSFVEFRIWLLESSFLGSTLFALYP